ncbi:MAG: MFS transporter [Lapillicoccus sp.]
MTDDAPSSGVVPSYRDVFRVPGFTPLYLVGALSVWGDYIARLAIAAVVFTRTQSALATAVTLAVSLVPTVIGRSLLGPIVDILPYRSVLVVALVARAVCVLALLWGVQSNAPIPLLLAILFLLELLGGPHGSASQVMWLDLIENRLLYLKAMGLGSLSEQVNQAAGLAVGGVLLGVVGARVALAIDAVTFLVSAVTVALVVAERPVARDRTEGTFGILHDVRAGARLIISHPLLARLLVLSCIATLAIAVPEAAAIPYAGDGRLGGFLMAAPIAGAAVGIVIVGRWHPRVGNARIITMAVLMPIPLLPCAFQPSLSATWVLWFGSGVLQAFMLPLQSTFTLLTPRARRGTMLGLAAGVSVGCAGGAYLVAGWLSEQTTPYAAVTICGIVCLGATIVLRATWPGARLDEEVRIAYES